MHKLSEVLSSVAAEQGDYIVLSIPSILCSNALDSGEVRAHIRGDSDSRRITKCFESKAFE